MFVVVVLTMVVMVLVVVAYPFAWGLYIMCGDSL